MLVSDTVVGCAFCFSSVIGVLEVSSESQGVGAWAVWKLGAVWALCRSFHAPTMADGEGRRAGAQDHGKQGQWAEVLRVVTGPDPGRYLSFAGN